MSASFSIDGLLAERNGAVVLLLEPASAIIMLEDGPADPPRKVRFDSRSSGEGLSFLGLIGGRTVSIVRVGLAETKNFSEGYDAIFGKKKAEKEEPKASAKADKPKADSKDGTKKKGKK